MENMMVAINQYRTGSASMVNTMPCNTEEDKKRILNGMNNADATLTDMINVPFKLIGFYSELSEKMNEETGEFEPMKSTVLFADDGKCYGTSSESVLRCLARFMMIFEGRDLMKNPLEVVARSKKAKNGQVTLLELL